MARVVVCGYMIRHPLAGNLLAYWQYVDGLLRLGHEVVYVEESGWPDPCYDPATREYGADPAAGLRAAASAMALSGRRCPLAYVDRAAGTVHGMTWDELKRVLGAADVLLDVGGVCWLPEFERCRRRVLVDMDPFFTQIGKFAAESLAHHHAHFSYGVNLGRAGCTIPTGSIDWQPTVPPVVPELWPAAAAPARGAPYTTIANWNAYGAVTWQGERYGQKDVEFDRFLALPGRGAPPLELALSYDRAGVDAHLRAAGFAVRDGGRVSADLAGYRAYLYGSRGEFSCAKHAYVKTRSGWFSDRSVCYLAAGRPVIVQDTGFTDWLPAGRGVLAFRDVDDAARGLAQVEASWAEHAAAARQIAAEVFGYRTVLPRLLAPAARTVVAPGKGERP